MKKSLLVMILTLFCGNLFAAATSEEERIDKRIIPLTIRNFTDHDMEFVYARTDPMNVVLPTTRATLPERYAVDIAINCLSGILLIPKLQKMLEVELSPLLKIYYFGNRERKGKLEMHIRRTHNPSVIRISSYLKVGDSHFDADSYDAETVPIADDEKVQDMIIDSCKEYLPSSEGVYTLLKPRHLRRSAG